MFSKLLYPTDFSDTAGKSIKYIIALRKSGAEKIVVLNVIHQRILDTFETMHKAVYFHDGRYQEDAEKAERSLEEKRAKQMEPVVAELQAAGFEVKTKIAKGYPVNEILKTEKEEAVSAIVMGSHGRSNSLRSRMGSVSEKVVRRSETPVLLVKR